LRTAYKKKYELEEMRADSHLQEVRARKQQALAQMKERYANKVSS